MTIKESRLMVPGSVGLGVKEESCVELGSATGRSQTSADPRSTAALHEASCAVQEPRAACLAQSFDFVLVVKH